MRKKLRRQLLSLMLALVCVLGMGITVYADAEYDSGMKKEEVMKKYSVDTGFLEGDEAFNVYLEVASDMLVNDKYAAYFRSKEKSDEIYEAQYKVYAEGTSEEWDEKTTFDKMLWYDLYINPLAVITRESSGEVLSSFTTFSHETCYMQESFLSGFDESLAEAYMDIMEWQYNYIVENNAVYNFMTGVDSNGNKPGSGGMSPVLIIVIVVVVALAGFVVLGKKKGNSGKKAA